MPHAAGTCSSPCLGDGVRGLGTTLEQVGHRLASICRQVDECGARVCGGVLSQSHPNRSAGACIARAATPVPQGGQLAAGARLSLNIERRSSHWQWQAGPGGAAALPAAVLDSPGSWLCISSDNAWSAVVTEGAWRERSARTSSGSSGSSSSAARAERLGRQRGQGKQVGDGSKMTEMAGRLQGRSGCRLGECACESPCDERSSYARPQGR